MRIMKNLACGSIASGAFALMVATAPVALAQTGTLVLACYAGDVQRNFEETIIPEFEKLHDVKVTYVPGVSTATIAKLAAQKDNPEIDVACLDDGPRQQAQDLGLLQQTDPSKLPNLADAYEIARMPDNYGVGWALFGIGIVYNPEALEQAGIPPLKSWNDLANPALKGHVIPSSITVTYGVASLIMLAQANGGDVHNIDPGFEKMKEIAANSIVFDTTADITQHFQQGEGWAGVWTDGQTGGYVQTTGFPMVFVYPEEGTPALLTTASVAKGAPNAEKAEEFLNFIVGKEAQTIIGSKIGFGPVNSKVELTPEEAARVTYGSEAAGKLVQLDWSTINAVRPEWTDRWNREIER